MASRMRRVRGTGPVNLTKSGSPQVRGPRVRPSKASTLRVRPRLASAGYSPPAGAGSGVARATSPMAATPSRYINKPKTASPSRGLGKPRADFPSSI